MRFACIFILFVIVLIAVGESEAWWGRKSSRGRTSSKSSSSSRSSSSRKQNAWGRIRSSAKKTLDKVKEKAKAAKDFVKGAAAGTKAMKKAYDDMREANWKNSDKYFHSRGNYDAAQNGPGGKWAAKVISDAREAYGQVKGDSAADRAADQKANEHGRNGGDPNKYRPNGLPNKYKK